jgi:hypothetical protein
MTSLSNNVEGRLNSRVRLECSPVKCGSLSRGSSKTGERTLKLFFGEHDGAGAEMCMIGRRQEDRRGNEWN